MRKYQRHSKKKMYTSIETWQSSELSLEKYCQQEGLAKSTFSYWLKKYRKEQGQDSRNESKNSFIPMQIAIPRAQDKKTQVPIEVHFPNGVLVRCPSHIGMQDLKQLIGG